MFQKEQYLIQYLNLLGLMFVVNQCEAGFVQSFRSLCECLLNSVVLIGSGSVLDQRSQESGSGSAGDGRHHLPGPRTPQTQHPLVHERPADRG